ncbi:peptidase M18 aminopeptidase I [Lineolata rhizophorae]|uniref:Peptidase M18 aminopeptidase I n=1 Tax=Lineolata rhizophorae TaxID=578093 RepID=A0A6A6NVT5_9PEZI|nr:peptidase M18 aminopeptidase I [Lineolata rhizophorae]
MAATAPAKSKASSYTQPFCDFLTSNPTVFHAVSAFAAQLEAAGFSRLCERDPWCVRPGGRYYVTRNGSSLMAFAVGASYEAGNGAAILAGHVDALTARLKPVPKLPPRGGYAQLGVAPYAGALNTTWWDRDLGIGGRVLVRKESGKVETRLVKLGWPIARIPTLAPHFGAPAAGPFNKETQMVPIIGLEGEGQQSVEVNGREFTSSKLAPEGSFVNTQPEKLVKAIAGELGIEDYSSIVNWELELFDVQPATAGGIDKEFIFAGRIDDKLCSWAAMQALLNSVSDSAATSSSSSIIKAVGLFDDEEIGSLLRQGARGNFLPATLERIVDSVAASSSSSSGFSTPSLLTQTYANSFLVSSDVTHALNPNFMGAYLEQHSPALNTGLVVCADSNGHMTTDAVSTAILSACADRVGATLQIFQIRNDVRSGGTVGPMLSSKMGMRAIDAGMPQLSMHSIRATTGSLDPGLGVLAFQGFLDTYEEVDKEFREC